MYKKFTIRKDIEFQTNSFFEILELLGKLALDTLMSGNPLLRRSEIVRQVSSYAFDYGLLIGHEDFRLIKDETADIFLTFPHRSLQEFLAAFYFVRNLGKRQTVNHVHKEFNEFLKNPLFSEFCLWFLDKSNRYFSFPERSVAIQLLSNYIAEQIDDVEVDFVRLEEKYPTLGLALNDNSEMALTMLNLSLTKSRKIKHLRILEHHPNCILSSLQPMVYERLKSIEVEPGRTARSQSRKKEVINLIPEEIPSLFVRSYNERNRRNSDIEVRYKILPSETSLELLDTVLKFTEHWRRSVHLRINWHLNTDLSADPSLSHTQWPSVHTLGSSHSDVMSVDFLASIASQGRFSKLSTLDITSNGNVGRNLEKLLYSSFLALDTLLLNSCGLDSNDLSSLARASANGRLPRLSTLDISNNRDIGGNLSTLFCFTSFPSLHSLFLSRCELNRLDVCSLTVARYRGLLPQLKNLDVSFNLGPHSPSLSNSNPSSEVLCMFPRLNSLVVRGCWLKDNDLYLMFQRTITDGDYFSDLTTLDMTFNPNISGYLSLLVQHCFPKLNILVLRSCALNSGDMMSLSQASNQGRLPELRHLDISQNSVGGETGGLFMLFGGLKDFPSLINLVLCHCGLKLLDLCCLTQARLDGKLPRIRHLDISFNGLSRRVGILSRNPITQREISWGSVICFDQ